MELSKKIEDLAEELASYQQKEFFRYNQFGALKYISQVLKERKKGIIVADEVGMGKTRVAIYTILANAFCGKSSLVIVPPGLIHQWEKEWNDVVNQLEENKLFIKDLNQVGEPLRLQRIEEIFQSNKYPLIDEKKPRMVLIPHSLSMRIQSNSRLRNIDLPQLIKSYEKQDYRSNIMKYRRDNYEDYEDYNYGESKLKAAKFLYEKINNFSNKEKELINDERMHFYEKQESRAYYSLTQHFHRGEAGYNLYFRAFFTLLGKFSFIVIDEAHKTKSSSGHDGILGELIKFAKNYMDNQVFTMGLTATPVELSPREWEGIVNRVGEKLKDIDVIYGFNQSVQNIRQFPRELKYQKEIIEHSIRFENFLKKNVTRRIRLQQEEFANLIELGNFDKNECFPHHQRERITIKQEELLNKNPLWLDVAFFYEAINKASKGLKDKNKAKLLDKTFARGNLNLEYISELIKELENKERCAQEERVLFWSKQLDTTLKEAQKNASLHPRLEKTLETVERLILNDDGTFKDEKVLIFTTFNESAKDLNDLINLSLTLRIIDKGIPIPISDNYIQELSRAFQDNPNSNYFGNLKGQSNILPILKSFQNFYENNRNKVTQKIDDDIFTDDDFIGDFFFKNNSDAVEIIKKFFSIQLIDEYFTELRFIYPNTAETEKTLKKEDIKASIHKEWKQIVIDYLSNEETLEEFEDNDTSESLKKEIFNADQPTNQGRDKEERRLDHYIDRINLNELKEILQNVLGPEEDINQPTSKISRRIYGGTKMNARKNVQSLFNDMKRFPKVLVAQSRVGREGLNLHKACRNLILFHQEWNPGVIEQQIGRIDRIDSYWERLLKSWYHNTDRKEDPPKINIFSIVFEGTYDEHQALILEERSKNLRAQLFGGILSEENLAEVDDNFKDQIKKAAPNFSPRNFFKNKES